MSLGISFCDNRKLFEEICDDFYNNGIFIVSSFDNLGSLSYPASFKNVIGVDMAVKKVPKNGYQYVENSPINIRFLSRQQYLPSLNNEYSNLLGSSFFSPYISSMIYKNFEKINNEFTVFQFLKENATEIYSEFNNYVTSYKCDLKISKAVIFPFNKEMTNILTNLELCNFKVIEVFDIKYLGQINKKISDILTFTNNDMIIKNIEKLDWTSEFDTFILGHIQEIENLTNKNYTKDIIKNCIKYNKKLYAIEDISKYLNELNIKNLNFYYPLIEENMVNNNTFGKLRCISKPILAVMGTSPKQGKYTLQLALRKVFLDKGYKVGQLGTEGTGFLFNFDEIYPTGYNSTVRINGNNSIYFINKLLSDIELKNPDIMILGTQSQTIHYNTGNLNCYTLKNIELILGSDPDGILLVINPTDTFEYIQRTIINLEVVYESKVIALVLFPINKTIKWSVLGNIYQKSDINEIKKFKKEIEKLTLKKCFIFDSEEEIEKIFNEVIVFFGKEV
ncbi:DUF1611 domain-containing protein [Streptobacillus moniliformis]|uniref:DUF1611 domain-containing protein n=1 Tax=Streptobacillus moniliformis TaxID=34105 RepID=UPI0007E4CFD5|nr:DUF1611 domain-containing protein [Streptobacillus moniliformis]